MLNYEISDLGTFIWLWWQAKESGEAESHWPYPGIKKSLEERAKDLKEDSTGVRDCITQVEQEKQNQQEMYIKRFSVRSWLT